MFKSVFVRAVFVGALLALSVSARAAGAGTSSAQFLKLGAGARAAAMGDAFAAVADDATATYWNPAGIAQIENPEVTAMQNNGLVETQYQFIAAVLPMGENALGISLSRMDYGDIDAYSAADVRQGSVDAGSLSAGLTFARKIGENVHLGATAKLVQDEIDGTSASTIAGDLGFLWRGEKTSIGVAVQHLGGTLKYEQGSR
jgi:long-subunit fatty acid transport protein